MKNPKAGDRVLSKMIRVDSNDYRTSPEKGVVVFVDRLSCLVLFNEDNQADWVRTDVLTRLIKPLKGKKYEES